jgi:hypothetical protein
MRNGQHTLLPSLYTREENWQRFATEIGAIYKRGDFWEPEQIQAVLFPWTVTLTLVKDDPQHRFIACTRLVARYLAADAFTFSVFREEVFAENRSLPTLSNIVVDHPRFEKMFRVTGQPVEQVRQLLANDAIRDYLLAETQMGLCTDPVPAVRAQMDLTCMVVGVVEEPERLLSLFELMGETLQHLCAIGSAWESEPMR